MPRMGTVQKEKYKTHHNVFDDFTNRNIYKLMNQGFIDGIQGPLSTGKEGNVFIAKKDGEKRIVKIYRLQTCDYNKMYTHIRTDLRYGTLKNQRREVIFAWAHREFRNLLKAREGFVRVPTPYTALFNSLVMEFIGDETAAPKLKDAKPDDPKEFFDEVIVQMKKMYKAGLVHGDLSGFNILNQDEKPVFIDMSQTTTRENPNAKEFLERDVRNICKLFRKWGVKADDSAVLKKITR